MLTEDRRKAAQWEELQRLLGEQTLADLEGETSGLRSEADFLVANADPEAVAEARAREPTVGDLEDLETGLREARGRRDTVHGDLLLRVALARH